ncbi:MAG TPA: leucyl aminopeptidase [Brevundimonas sp.]|nr:leucyl aminopeptidase [Brevundimonas sp.]
MQILFTDTPPANVRLVARIVNSGDALEGLDPAIAEGAPASRFKGSAGQVFEGFASDNGALKRVAIAGAGEAKADNRRLNVERAGAALTGKYLRSGEAEMVLDLGHAGLSAEEAAAALIGVRLRGWSYDPLRTKLAAEKKVSLDTVHVVGAPDGTQAAWEREAAIAKGVEFTKQLVTLPPNMLYPESFVSLCQEAFEGTGAEITVLDEAEMEELGMGALLGVGQGSARASRLLAIRWNGGNKGDKPTVFVGKGVTFDTGGISLKPGPGMEDMKWDMGGAAAVTGTMIALAGRKAKVNAVGVLGLVENMPDGNAQRPGDVVVSMSGQTVEVINTDAEGRLVLADALWYTQERFKPKFMIDLATLTGAMIVALGLDYAGVFSNSDEVAEPILAASKKVGENFWRMPIPAIYEQHIDSKIADVKNTGNGRAGGSITAALFLQRFTNGVPWAHLDIAPTAWANKSPSPTVPEGGVGFAVRTLDRMVADTYEA